MRFPRQAKVLRGPLDATPVAGVLFLLALFILLASLLNTPGTLLEINLPEGQPAGGLDAPALVVAVDNRGQFFFENTPVTEQELKTRLQAAAQHSKPLAIVLRADRTVQMQVFTHVSELAAQAGVTEVVLAERPPLPTR